MTKRYVEEKIKMKNTGNKERYRGRYKGRISFYLQCLINLPSKKRAINPKLLSIILRDYGLTTIKIEYKENST